MSKTVAKVEEAAAVGVVEVDSISKTLMVFSMILVVAEQPELNLNLESSRFFDE